MPNWKKVIVSGSSAHLNQITASADINVSGNSLLDFNYSAQTVQGNVTASSAAHTIVVTVISKTSNHPYINLGSSSGYSLDGIESPWLNLTEGIYKFDVSHSSVGSHPFRFYFDAAKTQQYTANVDTSESGAVYLTVNKDTPQVLYYQCSSHGYMGFGLSTGMNPLVQDEDGMKTLISGSAQITHDDTTGFVANEHIDHSGVTLTAGTGLTGGGDITTNRSFAVDFGDSTLQTHISGSFTQASSSISTRLTTAESELSNTLVSSSAQLATDISGSFTDVSSSLSTRTTTLEGASATTGSNHFKDDQIISGSLTVTDTIIAQEFKTEFVSASITFSSGSTIFGNSADDTHKFTGHITSSGNISGSSTSTGSFGYIKIPDDGKIALGDSEDLRIYHNGNHSVIRDRGTGNLILRTNAFQVKNSDDTETMLQANADGNVTLRHNNNQKFATTSDGVSVTGNVITSGNVSGSSTSTGSFGKLLGDASDLTNLPSAAITNYSSTGDNRIITSVNSTNVQGEANLTFDGTSLTLTGQLTSSGDISGSSTSTGSFGVIEVGGGHFTSASLASGGSGGGDSSVDADAVSGSFRGLLSGSLIKDVGGGVSGSSTSTGSFGRVEGDGSGLSGIAAAIEVSDEGSSLTSTVSSLNFVGDNIVATNSGNDVTVTLNNTNSTGDAKVVQISSASTTWAVTHSLSTKYPVVTIWDDNDQVIIPESITADTTNTATITFEQAMTGRASFTLGVPSSSYFVSESTQILTTVADSTIDGDLTITGTLTAQEFHTEVTSASIVFTSGSTIFGNSSDDIHNMTGSLNISGSLTLNDGSLTVTDNVDFNGDLDVDGTTNLDVVDIDGAVDMASNLTIAGNVTGSSTSTGSFGEVRVGGMSLKSLTTFSSSVATKLNTLDADIIALSIALG